MPERFDVVVVGAGPTGLTLVHLLARHAVRILLVEQNASTVSEPRAVSIDDESLRTLQATGLVQRAMRDIAPAYGSEYYGPDGSRYAVVSPSEGEFGWPKRSAFRQPQLERVLAEALSQKPNIEVRFGTRCTDHADDGEKVTVRLRTGDMDSDIECRYLVGADGGRSRTRKAIGAVLSGSSFEERWLIADILDTVDPYRETKVFSDPERPALSLPGPQRTRRYEIRLRPGETEAEMTQESRARALIAQYGGDADARLDRLRVYTFQARVADFWRRGRVFLAGDAAHLTPPFAGQGMNTGLRDASNLAWKLGAVLEGRLGERLLDTYQQERRDHAWSMIRFAVRMGFLISPRSRLVAGLTRLVLRAARICPPLRDWLVQMRFKPKPKFTGGFRSIEGALSRQLSGTMFPQPAVEQDGETVKLDEVLGPDFSILCFAAEPAALARAVAPLADRLGARVIGCLPRNYAFAREPFAPAIRDSSATIEHLLRGTQDVAVVLRPDRYIAAILEAGNAAQAQSLSGLIDATFPHGHNERPRSR